MPEENTPQAENGRSENVPNIPELDRYLFSHDEYTAGIVPRKLVSEEVARYLIGKIKPEHDIDVFSKVELTADFYDTTEIGPAFTKFLNKGESDETAIRKSATIARIIARCGTTSEVEFAKQYYRHLIEKADTFRAFEDLVLLHEAIGLGGESSQLRQRIKKISASLEAKAGSDYSAQLELKNLQWPIEQKLQRAEKVEPIKQKILSTPDYKERVFEEIKAYLGIGVGYVEHIYPWSARRLRRETWSRSVAEQVTRNDATPLKKHVAALMREYISDPALSPEGKPSGNESLRLRLLRAIKFFGGEITEDEESFLKAFSNKQADILANEGFLLDQ